MTYYIKHPFYSQKNIFRNKLVAVRVFGSVNDDTSVLYVARRI